MENTPLSFKARWLLYGTMWINIQKVATQRIRAFHTIYIYIYIDF
jgi:hypothetical protein